MQHRLKAHGLIIGAVALIAVAAGHAIELALENHGILGDARAGYAHVAQLPILEMATLLFAFALFAITDAVLRSVAARRHNSDYLLPSLGAIAALRPAKLFALLAPAQLAAFTVAELAEQSVGHFAHPNVAAIFGAGHITAIPVHLIVAACFAVALWLGARFVRAQASNIVELAQVAIAWIDPRPASASPSAAHVRALRAAAVFKPPKALARRIANRPPPVSAPRPA